MRAAAGSDVGSGRGGYVGRPCGEGRSGWLGAVVGHRLENILRAWAGAATRW